MAREGVEYAAPPPRCSAPPNSRRSRRDDNLQLAYDLGRRAFLDNPDCDGVYIGGGAWLAEPVSQALEKEFGKPVICNQTAQLWDTLHILKEWQPIKGYGRLLAAA